METADQQSQNDSLEADHDLKLKPYLKDYLKAYLKESAHIDVYHPSIQECAARLAAGSSSDTDIAKNVFLFVRDEIDHSWDAKRNPVTCKASDVLAHKTGYCYAKSHLLAALMRANQIPAGLCYQRLTITPGSAPFCLHGLNAIWLKEFGWYRIDARGNKETVDAQFIPPKEQLAFPIETPGEADLPEIWAEPLPTIIETLTTYTDYLDVANHLPDVPIIQSSHSLHVSQQNPPVQNPPLQN